LSKGGEKKGGQRKGWKKRKQDASGGVQGKAIPKGALRGKKTSGIVGKQE